MNKVFFLIILIKLKNILTKRIKGEIIIIMIDIFLQC